MITETSVSFFFLFWGGGGGGGVGGCHVDKNVCKLI